MQLWMWNRKGKLLKIYNNFKKIMNYSQSPFISKPLNHRDYPTNESAEAILIDLKTKAIFLLMDHPTESRVEA
jgi:hypothetical protein